MATKSLGAGLLLLICVCVVQAQPVPSDPDGMAMGGAPGQFPTTVAATNIQVDQFVPAVLGGSNSDNLRVTFPSGGPIAWTSSRMNEGDIALSIGPGNPDDPSYFPPNAFVNNYGPIANGPFENSTLAWRVSRSTGAALATVRHNGVDFGPNFTFGGSPVGTIHGVAYFNVSGSQGWGFQMDTGEFRNGGGSSTDLQIGIAGFDSSQGESTSSAATAYFPYEQGWVGAWVNAGTDGEATYNNTSPGLPTSVVNYSATVATVTLPGVDSATDGMLFVAPTHDDNRTNIAAAFPNAGGWTVSVREDEGVNLSGDASSLVPGTENGFQFLYVPYSAPGLIGGQVSGADASMIHSSGDGFFDISRNAAGEYALSVYDTDGQSKLTGDDGMLILSVSGAMAETPTLADRAFMSYEYDSVSGDFIIQSRHLAAVGSPNSENQFGDFLELRDVDFYVAWIDFDNPLSPADSINPGDFNDDGFVDAADYTVWRDNLGAPAGTLPNDNSGLVIGDPQYQTWKDSFGQQGAIGAGAVPEPAAWALLLLSAIGLGLGRR